MGLDTVKVLASAEPGATDTYRKLNMLAYVTDLELYATSEMQLLVK